MATFSNCLNIINRMSQRDQDALLARLDELQAQGLSAKEAQLQAAIDVLAQVQGEGQIRKSDDRGYVTEDEISKMYTKAWGDLRRDKKYNELSKAVEDAETADRERFNRVHRRAIEILKSRPGFSKIADEYDDKTVGNLARVFMDQADADVPPASPSVQDALRARQQYVDYYFKDVAKIPEPREFSQRANQQRDYYDTPAFKRWFKQSKVVDAQGNPLVAFHVTSNDFVEFDTAAGAKAGKKTTASYSGQLGSWFTAPSLYDGNYEPGNAEAAIEGFVETDSGAFKDGANTMPVHLSIQNPMEYSDFESMLDDRDLFKSIAAYKRSLVDQGYDGIVIRNSDTDGGVDRDDWVAFEPTQIKSAIGNNGQFDPFNPDIRKSTERLIEDIPNEDWLQGKIDYAQSKGRNQFGVPFMGTVTGYFKDPVDVSVRVLSKLKGERDEQNNVREESLDYIRKNWDEVSKQPPYIEVAYNGEAWVSEGNHRIMVAAEKGIESLPVEIRYFDGGQRRNGPLAPDRIPSLENPDIYKSPDRRDLDFKDVIKRTPELQDAAQKLKAGEMTAAEYDALVNKYKPVSAYDEVPEPASVDDMRKALTSDKVERIGAPMKELKAGHPVGLRLDIPAYANHGVWVVSVHEQDPGFSAGKSIGYESVAAIKNARFGVVENAALNIAGGKPKATIAVVKGDWEPMKPAMAKARSKAALKSKDWTQVGMDPERHAYFYDRKTMEPVVSADEVIQIGPLVLAKNAVFGNKSDFRFSPDRPWFDDLSELKVSTNYQLGDLLKSSKKLSWWSRTIGTQYDLAQKHPQFKRVFDAVQRFINDVSAYATRAADLAPTILPKLETWKDIGRSPLSAEDVKALRDPIFGGTLKYTRDEDGNIVETEDVSTAGVVFKDEELRSMFGLNDRQIGLYREFRRATNKSLSDLAVSDMLRYLGNDGEGVRQRALEAGNLDGALNAMVAHLDQLIEQQPERAKVLEDSKRAIKEKAGQAIGLMARGYAPLSRFGQYTVYVVGSDGEQIYFSMFENQRDANKMAREMQEQYPDATVTTGTMSQESYKLFSGVTPETLALFGESLGLEESGVDPKSEVFQQYLKMAKTNRSAMKRLIQRKGIDGFSEDAGRVLAGFVYSNARQISTNLHAGEIGRSAAAVTDGDVKDAAIRLMEYVQNPREEAQAIRGLLFTQFIGGSVASAMVNLTQPFTMTMPYLSQFDGVAGAAKRMAEAVKLVSRGIRNDDELKAALKKAEDEGVVSPQEVHQLMAQAQGKGSLQTGDGTRAGDAAAKINNAMAKLGLGWGKVFSAAEQFNRRVTFIAAYKLARDQGMADPMAFAEKAIAETQGIYNKGNKPTWARGAVGSTLFTFKQYSIGYIEFLRRMWGNGPEGKKAVGLALAVLFLSAGLGGMPGADDLDDIIDGFMQRVLGRSFDTKQAKKEFFASILGQSGAEFVMSGLSGLPGVPIDISGRMSLGNLVPGTGFFTKKRDYGRDYLEIAGPAGTLFTNIGTAVGQVASGEAVEGVKTLLPVAGQNFLKAADMATMGYYRDQKGRKVIDTDAWDAFAKGIGFQPRAVAQVQEATATQANLITQNKLRETEIADKWAQGRIERNPAKVEEAKQELADWNRNNPESPIRIDPTQINKRVQEANKTKAQRVAATAPNEIRGAVKRELERVD